MLAQERQDIIMDMLKQCGGIIKMKDIVTKFGVSNETARRDLETLQEKNLVKRIYGGAVLANRQDDRNFLLPRSEEVHGQADRAAIGKAAAELIHDGDTILLATGTTVLQVARHLKHLHSLTILTNSLAIANEMCNTDFDIFILGGKLDVNEKNMYGDIALNTIKSVFVDKAVVGAGGITFDFGVSDYGIHDNHLREEMIRHANQTILVAQSEKFGTNALSIGFPLSSVHTVVSDTNLSKEYVTGIRDMGIKLILTQP